MITQKRASAPCTERRYTFDSQSLLSQREMGDAFEVAELRRARLSFSLMLLKATCGFFHFVCIASVVYLGCEHFLTRDGEESFFRSVRNSFWEYGARCSRAYLQRIVVDRRSTSSQVNAIFDQRSGGICHYCLPTGFSQSDVDKNIQEIESYAHRCVIAHCDTSSSETAPAMCASTSIGPSFTDASMWWRLIRTGPKGSWRTCVSRT